MCYTQMILKCIHCFGLFLTGLPFWQKLLIVNYVKETAVSLVHDALSPPNTFNYGCHS